MGVKNKKGVSDVVTTVVLIAMTIMVVLVAGFAIQKFVLKQTEDSKACFNSFGKLALDPQYTCFNSTAGELYFSIKRENISLDGILVSVVGETRSMEFHILDSMGFVNESLSDFAGSTLVIAPALNGAKTYLLNTSYIGIPKEIGIYPVFLGKQCEKSDSIKEVGIC
jgi:flagellin-like protein